MLETEALTRRFGGLTAVDALRALMLQNGVSTFGLTPRVLLMRTAVRAFVGAYLYPRVVL